MVANRTPLHIDHDETWRRLESLVDELAHWAETAPATAEFYGLLLQRAATELPIQGATIWQPDSQGRVRRGEFIGAGQRDAVTQLPEHHERVQRLFQEGGAVTTSDVAAGNGSSATGCDARNSAFPPPSSTDLTSSLAPVVVEGRVVAVIQWFLPVKTALADRKNVEHVMAALADVAADFQQSAELTALRQQATVWNAGQGFSDSVHKQLELDETCYAIVNEGRRFVDADRVSLLVAKGGSFQIRAISGVDIVDRRAPEVLLLRRLARTVAAFGEAIWSQDATDHPPEIQELLDQYHDLGGARTVAIIPLRGDLHGNKSRAVGVLVVEQFNADTIDASQQKRLAICCRSAATALTNSLEMHSLPLLGVSRALRWIAWMFGFQSFSSFAVALAAALVVVAGLVAAMCLVTVDFSITARGQLQPVEQQDIFAPADGIVEQTLVHEGDEVQRGDILVRLRNTTLDYETEHLTGELATTRAKLQAIQAARAVDRRDRQQVAQHNAEIERLKEVVTGLERQLDILRRQHDELEVRTPLAGQVLSWEPGRSLDSRPVRQGQRLMTIANLHGRWQLEVDVPDEEIGHLLHARQTQGNEALPVSFILLTDPATSHRGRLTEVGLSTNVTDSREPAVRAVVDLDQQTLASPRPGAGVVARIHCGRRSVGYVWFRRFYEQLRRRVLL